MIICSKGINTMNIRPKPINILQYKPTNSANRVKKMNDINQNQKINTTQKQLEELLKWRHSQKNDTNSIKKPEYESNKKFKHDRSELESNSDRYPIFEVCHEQKCKPDCEPDCEPE